MKQLLAKIETMNSRAFQRLKWALSTVSATLASLLVVSLEV